METSLFEQISRNASRAGRRSLLRALLIGGIGSTGVIAGASEAKRRKKKRNKWKGRCFSDYACALDEICKGGKCVTGCRINFVGCYEGQTCSPQTELCVTKCSNDNNTDYDDSKCQLGEVCHRGFNAPYCGVPCRGSADCPSLEYGCNEGYCMS